MDFDDKPDYEYLGKISKGFDWTKKIFCEIHGNTNWPRLPTHCGGHGRDGLKLVVGLNIPVRTRVIDYVV